MKEKEIVQALKICLNGDGDCATCAFRAVGGCVSDLGREAAGLIERLSAENAALRNTSPAVDQRRGRG